MNRQALLQRLGLGLAATATEIESALHSEGERLQRLVASSTDAATASRHTQLLRELEQLAFDSGTAASPPRVAGSPLTETMLQDLPQSSGETAVTHPTAGDNSNDHAPKPRDGGLTASMIRDLPGQTPIRTLSPTDGPPTATLVGVKPGQIVANRYEVRRLLGAGGMGAVFAAFDRTRQEEIAVKVILPGLVQQPTARERFLAEARIAIALGHPSIIKVFDVQQDGDLLFLSMELLEGTTLRQRLMELKRNGARMPLDEALHIGRTVGGALLYAHATTVHRDVKPENIFLQADGRVTLMDFGIARLLSTSQLTATGAAMGTAYYMAPEQLQGEAADHRADQYSLAVVVYEQLAGVLPVGMIKPLRSVRRDVPAAVSRAIERAMQGSPAERFASMEELIAQWRPPRRWLPQLTARSKMGIAAVTAVTLLATFSTVPLGRWWRRFCATPQDLAEAPRRLSNERRVVEGLVTIRHNLHLGEVADVQQRLQAAAQEATAGQLVEAVHHATQARQLADASMASCDLPGIERDLRTTSTAALERYKTLESTLASQQASSASDLDRKMAATKARLLKAWCTGPEWSRAVAVVDGVGNEAAPLLRIVDLQEAHTTLVAACADIDAADAWLEEKRKLLATRETLEQEFRELRSPNLLAALDRTITELDVAVERRAKDAIRAATDKGRQLSQDLPRWLRRHADGVQERARQRTRIEELEKAIDGLAAAEEVTPLREAGLAADRAITTSEAAVREGDIAAIERADAGLATALQAIPQTLKSSLLQFARARTDSEHGRAGLAAIAALRRLDPDYAGTDATYEQLRLLFWGDRPESWDCRVLDPLPVDKDSRWVRAIEDVRTGIQFQAIPRTRQSLRHYEGARACFTEHTVEAVYLGRTEVTLKQWQKFLHDYRESKGIEYQPDAASQPGVSIAVVRGRAVAMPVAGATSARPLPAFEFECGANHPVCLVSHRDAREFCSFYGFRLPTESEWHAACMAHHQTVYPWGDDPAGGLAVENLPDASLTAAVSAAQATMLSDCFAHDDGAPFPVTVDALGANAQGLKHVLGNVREWCEHDAGSTADASEVPIRGACFWGPPASAVPDHRYLAAPTDCFATVGFRVAFDLAAAKPVPALDESEKKR